MAIETLILLYVAATLGGICLLAFYQGQRQRRFGHAPTKDHIFRCKKCSYVYTDDADVDRSRCPQCGRLNEAISF
ncbi:MAG TPA: hypothetical protein VGP94_17195 [Tepidisphaeraceae bacterium]|nr:hypothetical protein [Tepidisphaeraceae bacterium]